jgi:hypothetical protein
VGDEQRGRADLDLDPPDLVAELHAHLRVEGRQRLVQQQHLGLDRERPRERDALLLAAGHLVGEPVGLCPEPDELEHVAGALLALRVLDPPQPQPEGDVLPRRHVREQRVGLEHHAHAALVRGQRRDVLAPDHDAPAVRLLEAGDQAQGGGLAAAGRAEQRHQLAGARVR